MSQSNHNGGPGSMVERWDARYHGMRSAPEPALILRQWSHLVPQRGAALDLACGLGGNALWLAEQGLRVSAWDLSGTAIGQLREAAQGAGVRIDAEVRDVTANPPAAASFDLVCVVHFLERALAPAIAASLRPGGRLFYQTFTAEALSDRGPKNPAYRLGANELLALFPGLRVLGYREEGRRALPGSGLGDLALLVAERADGAAG